MEARAQRPETRPAATRPSAARTRVGGAAATGTSGTGPTRPAVDQYSGAPQGGGTALGGAAGSDQHRRNGRRWLLHGGRRSEGPAISAARLRRAGLGRRKSWQPEESRQLPDPGRRLRADTVETTLKTHIERSQAALRDESGEPYGRYRNFVNICVMKAISDTDGIGNGATAFDAATAAIAWPRSTKRR